MDRSSLSVIRDGPYLVVDQKVREILLPNISMCCLTLVAKRIAKKNGLLKNLTVELLLPLYVVQSSDRRTNHSDRSTHRISLKITSTRRVRLAGQLCLVLPCCAINRADFKQDLPNLQKHVFQREGNGDASETALLKCVELSVREDHH
jgi:sodium/potassium-transporting ATPase subunit alpha